MREIHTWLVGILDLVTDGKKQTRSKSCPSHEPPPRPPPFLTMSAGQSYLHAYVTCDFLMDRTIPLLVTDALRMEEAPKRRLNETHGVMLDFSIDYALRQDPSSALSFLKARVLPLHDIGALVPCWWRGRPPDRPGFVSMYVFARVTQGMPDATCGDNYWQFANRVTLSKSHLRQAVRGGAWNIDENLNQPLREACHALKNVFQKASVLV